MNSFLVILPPLLVVMSALYTERMILSFIVGIVASACIATHLYIPAALQLIATRWWASTGLDSLSHPATMYNNWNICIFVFLFSIGIIITLLKHTGAAHAYTRFAQGYIRSKQGAEIATLILASVFFIDDYFCALTVGSVMRPLALRYGIHPLKLALLTTAMASPLALLTPLSSWVGEIILQLKLSGISNEGSVLSIDPFFALLNVLPFLFYPLMIIASAWYIVLRRISFGPLAQYEQNTHPTNAAEHNVTHATASLLDFILPIMSLIASVILGLLISGNYWLVGGTATLLEALQQAQIHHAFFWAGIISVTISMSYFFIKGRQSLTNLYTACIEGVKLMIPSVLMLIHAWTLAKLLTYDLQTGMHIAPLLSHIIYMPLFPALCFISATLIAWMIGSAWATMGLLLPIAIPLVPNMLGIADTHASIVFHTLMPVIGAILSGSVLGTHYSLLSDTPIMSALSAGTAHIEHIKTMAWYLIPISIGVLISYSTLGIIPAILPLTSAWPAWGMSMTIGIGFILFVFEWRTIKAGQK